MNLSSSPFASGRGDPPARTLLNDRLVRVSLGVWLGYAGLVFSGVELTSRFHRAVAVFFVGWTLLGLRYQLSQVRTPEDRAFWNDLGGATACWLAAPVLYLLFPYAPAWAGWSAQVLYALFYGGLYLALSLRPHHRHRWRPVVLERSLTWATVTVAVTGLFLYFLAPVFVDPASYDRGRSATGLFLILDTYFTIRLLYLSRSTRSTRWKWTYSLLAATTFMVLTNDLVGAFTRDSSTGSWDRFLQVSWKLPPLLLLLAARLRHHPFPVEAPVPLASYPRDDSFPGPLGQTMIFALLFPLVHIAGYQAHWLNAPSREPRSWIVLVWLLLLAMVAFYQHRRLRRTTADLRLERERTERALRRIEDDLSLRKKLQSVEASRSAANEIFAKAFQASPDVMAITRLDDGEVVDMNASCLEVFGLAPRDAVGKSLADLPIWARPRDRLTLERLLDRHASLREVEGVFRRKSGELGVGLYSAERIDLNGVPHVFSILHDVTENQHRDRDLELRARWLESARTAVCALDASGKISYWNRAAARLFGAGSKSTLDRPVEELPGWGPHLAAAKERAPASVGAELAGRRILARAFPVADPQGPGWLILAVEDPSPQGSDAGSS